MKTLLVAATKFEVEQIDTQNSSFELFITGIGLVNTILNLTKHLTNHSYDRIIQVGIAGSFNYNQPLTELVEVTQEQIGDLGAENLNEFIAFENEILTNKSSWGLREVASISVNTCSGSENTIRNRIKHFNPDIENMEGYAFFKVCQEFEVKNYHQIRSISNYVEPRNKANWKTQEAIEQLNLFIQSQIEKSTL